MPRKALGLLLACWFVGTCPAEELLARPAAGADLGRIGAALAGPFVTVLRPDKDAPEWWAGAPSVVRAEDGTFWMACRMRTGEGSRGLRGYEVRLLNSSDGERFEVVKHLLREDVPLPGFERSALLRDAATGKWKLYLCGPWKDRPWCILKLDDAANPADFVAITAKPVITPRAKTFERDLPPVEYKDPVITFAEGAYHAYVIGYARQNERIYHFSSPDGETWTPVGNPYEPLLPLGGWHDFFTRPASILPAPAGYLFVYEGSKLSWHDPVYNIATGLAFTFDLHRLIDLTPEAPLAVSTTPNTNFATLRYSSWLTVNGETWIYAEAACADETHEIRLFKVK